MQLDASIAEDQFLLLLLRKAKGPDRRTLTFMRLLEADTQLFLRLCCFLITWSGVVMRSQAVIGHVDSSRRIFMQRVIIAGATSESSNH
ncbi:hypothetical protein KCU87_g334, partial [Aureobasidium melanogenum]